MSTHINRRNFLKNTLYASMAAGAGLGLGAPGRALAAHCLDLPHTWSMPRTLVNVMLYGGMDSKFIFMPHPTHDATYASQYAEKIWAARENLYGNTGTYTDYGNMYDDNYTTVTDPGSGLQFGIYNRCGWLISQFNQGRVAVIANSFCSKNRRHDQSQLNANSGDPAYNTLYYDRDGWGGRLTEEIGSVNTVELSHEISIFGNGRTAGERLDNVIHARYMRDIALPNPASYSKTSDSGVMTRAIKSYYEARGQEVLSEKPAEWPYHLFYQHSAAFREFGDKVNCRLADFALPGSLSGIDLYSGHFEQQCRNLYDICLTPDIMNSRVVSMRYDGWDTHNNQNGRIGNNLEDLFGANSLDVTGGFDTAMTQIAGIATADAVPANDQLLVCFTTDFGRQLRANGDSGTDHGRGLYNIMVGKDVNSNPGQRVYGEMFPERESNLENGKIPLETSGADVQGRTSTEHILAKACDWVEPGTGANTFTDLANADIESAGLLDNLLA